MGWDVMKADYKRQRDKKRKGIEFSYKKQTKS